MATQSGQLNSLTRQTKHTTNGQRLGLSLLIHSTTVPPNADIPIAYNGTKAEAAVELIWNLNKVTRH